MHVHLRFTVLQILLGEDSPCPKIKQVKIHQSRNLYTSRFDVKRGVASLTTLEEGEFKVPIDGCIR